MSNRFAKFYVIPIIAVALMAIQSAHAQSTPAAEPVALSNLQTMVNNLGYTTTLSPDKQHFYFQWQSPKYNYQIDMVLSTNGDLVYLYNYINVFDASDVARMPVTKMMEYQNTNDFFFSFGNESKGEDLYANAIFGTEGITPALLRTRLADFVNSLDNTDTLWNTSLWK
jgi:hypothetical protein